MRKKRRSDAPAPATRPALVSTGSEATLRPIRSGEKYLRRVEGGVVQASAPADGLVVQTSDGASYYVASADVLAAIQAAMS